MTNCFRCVLGASMIATFSNSLCARADGVIRTVTYAGFPAPGATADVEFATFGTPTLNNHGKVAFRASLRSSTEAVSEANDSGIWSEGHGTLRMLAREGSRPPDTTADWLFDQQMFDDPGYPLAPLINNSGQSAFVAGLKPSSGEPFVWSRGVWSDRRGELRLIAGDEQLHTTAGVIPAVINL